MWMNYIRLGTLQKLYENDSERRILRAVFDVNVIPKLEMIRHLQINNRIDWSDYIKLVDSNLLTINLITSETVPMNIDQRKDFKLICIWL